MHSFNRCRSPGKGYLDNLPLAVDKGLVQRHQLEDAMRRSLLPRFRVGLYDPDHMVPWSTIPLSVVEGPEHHALAREVARSSYVLLKNDGILPLKPSIQRVAVVGPAANCSLVGRYSGFPAKYVTMLEGITVGASSQGVKVLFGGNGGAQDLKFAIETIHKADVAILFMSPEQEGESHDREAIGLPSDGQNLLAAAVKTGTPLVVVAVSGGPLALKDDDVSAHIAAGIGGMEAGSAMFDVLWGHVNPSARLAATVYTENWVNASDFLDMGLRHRGHRYMSSEQVLLAKCSVAHITSGQGVCPVSLWVRVKLFAIQPEALSPADRSVAESTSKWHGIQSHSYT